MIRTFLVVPRLLPRYLGMPRLGLPIVRSKARLLDRGKAVTAIAKGMSLFPFRQLQLMETVAALGQGKGWGAGTHVHEVSAALALLKPSATDATFAVDAGANCGAWSAELLRQRPDFNVVAFEPSADAAQRCRDRFRNNPRVEVIQQALGSESGTATLSSDSPGGVIGTLSQPRQCSETLDFRFQETVQVVTLDWWAAKNSFQPSLLKMDVEGLELEVLSGASNVLPKLKVIQFEFGPANLRSRTFFFDYWEVFASHGFVIHILTPRGLRRVYRYTEALEIFRTTNFFAARS